MTDRFLPSNIPLSAITKELREVAKLCGVETAAALVREFGGTRIWVPKKWSRDHFLNDIGEDAAVQFFAYFAKSELSVPRTLFTAAGRRELIRQLHDAGLRDREIARTLGCSQRVVRDELGGRPRAVSADRRRRVDPRQLDLEEYLNG